MTQKEIAKKFGVSPEYVSQVKTGVKRDKAILDELIRHGYQVKERLKKDQQIENLKAESAKLREALSCILEDFNGGELPIEDTHMGHKYLSPASAMVTSESILKAKEALGDE